MLLILFSIFLIILIPVYTKIYGIQNFLWFSDIGLFITFFGLLFNSPLLISMAAVGILPFEIIWSVDFFIRLFTGSSPLDMTDYMFDNKLSKFVRALSFFHLIVPIIWFFLLYQWGYDQRAFLYQSGLIWIVLLLTYFFTDVTKNINWVFLPEIKQWKAMPSLAWLGILMVGFPILLLPFHFLFTSIFN